MKTTLVGEAKVVVPGTATPAVVTLTRLASGVEARSGSSKVTVISVVPGTWSAFGAGTIDSTFGGERSTVRKWLVAACARCRPKMSAKSVPTSIVMAFLVNPNNPIGILEAEQTAAAAHKLGIRLRILDSINDHEFDMHLAALVNSPPDAVLVATDPLLTAHRRQLIATMARQRIPAIYSDREFAAAGGLISYASSESEAWRQAGDYVGRILKGEKPADLPVVLPTRFDLVINLQTAKALGIAVPPTIRALATEVIE